MALGRTDSFQYSSPRDTGFFARGTAAYHRRMAEPVAGPRHTNKLAGETSPYLLQHAHNPVDWMPWGPDALARAKLLDRPIFLSIGYAACHWCHVMERESFEDEATAAELNAGFVAIKVDREERPDLDQLYMGAVQTMTGGGGWPMSVFLTPEGRPFYGGTYFPDTPRHGMPSFRQVLDGVRTAWTTQRPEVEQAGVRLVDALVESQAIGIGGRAVGVPPRESLDAAAAAVAASFDPVHGGWGRAPKFPQPMTIEFLLRRHVASGDPEPLEVALRSLGAMAAGGIHDQLGGGFHRYATDAAWLVPHFEQMLYDNAQLARVYVHAWALTGDASLLATATAVLDYMLRELATAGRRVRGQPGRGHRGRGGRHVRLDGRRGARGPGRRRCRCSRPRTGSPTPATGRAGRSCRASGVTPSSRSGSGSRSARSRPGWPSRVPSCCAGAPRGRSRRSTTRCSRPGTGSRSPRSPTPPDPWPRPGTRRWSRRRHATPRRRRGRPSAVLDNLRRPDGRLRRSWRDGRASADGALEDYANLADGLLSLYEATFDERWFEAAVSLMDVVLGHFPHPDGGFYDTPDDGERLVVRPRDVQDNATPSGGAMATTVLLRLAALTGEGRYRTAAERALATVGGYLDRHPTAFAQWLCALELAHAESTEVAIVGEPGDPATRALVDIDRPRLPPVPGPGLVGGAGRLERCRCSTAGSRSTAGRRRSCATASRAACR